MYIYEIIFVLEQFDLIGAFDFNPTPKSTELHQKNDFLF